MARKYVLIMGKVCQGTPSPHPFEEVISKLSLKDKCELSREERSI